VQDVFLFKSFRGESSKLKLESEVKAYAVLLEMENLAPNIATCYGSFTHNGSHTIVLESANAGDLAELYEDQKSPETLADILQFWKSLSGILRGLAWVHERGFVT
jgi:serine/threonine protein kinase